MTARLNQKKDKGKTIMKINIKKLTGFTLLMLLALNLSACFSQSSRQDTPVYNKPVPYFTDGNKQKLPDIYTFNIQAPQIKAASRRIWVYLPPDYDKSGRHYPVLYMHDGQNLFDEKTSFSGQWEAGISVDRLVKEGKTHGAIIVGIDNGEEKRESEYAPWKGCSTQDPHGAAYADFIVHSLKPVIDATYRTYPDREHTAVGGSSSGGNISLYIVEKYPEIFGRAALFSPALWCQQAENRAFLDNADMKQGMRIYMDVGTNEGEGNEPADYLREAKHINTVLSRKEGVTVKFIIDEGGKHHEKYWAKRFPAAFLWLFEGLH